MPVATGGARLDIIGIGTAPVLAGSTHTGASAGMAVAGIARARKTSALMSAFARTCPLYPRKRTCAVQNVMSDLGHKRTQGLY